MSKDVLNTWTVRGILATDVVITTVELENGKHSKVADATICVSRVKERNESFAIHLNIWEGSAAWRTLHYLQKGSPIICIGRVEPCPYISPSDGQPQAGLMMEVLDIDLKSWLDGRSRQMRYSAVA